MEALPFNAVDGGVALFFLLAALLGLSLGFVRGGLMVLSWAAAIAGTLYLFPSARPFFRQWIEAQWMADLAAGIALFIALLVLMTVLSAVIGSWVRGSALNSLDRSLGMVAGLIVAGLVTSAVYAAVERMWDKSEQPDWLRQAKVLPLVEGGAGLLMGLLPADAADQAARAAREAEQKAREALEAEKALRGMLDPKTGTSGVPDKTGGYDERQRRDMDTRMEQLIDGNR